MVRVQEAAQTVKEHLSLEEIQLAIGDFCVAATGYGILGAEFIFDRMDFKTWMAAAVVGQAAAGDGLKQWRLGREKNRL